MHYGLPTPWLTVIFSLDDGVESASERADLITAKPHPIVAAGLHTRASFVLERPDQTGIQLAVHPLACRDLFGLPAAALSATEHDGRDVLGRAAVSTQQRLTDESDWSSAFAVLGSYLRRSLDERRRAEVRSEVRHAWHLLERSGGRLPVADVAAAVGVTSRHLGTLFRREVGHPPKTIAQLFRFEQAVEEVRGALRRHGRVDLAAVAARAGYADQSHLTRDFVARLGVPPSRWLAEEFRNLQGYAADPRQTRHHDY